MILAAGLGTRLRPLTERTPKALVSVGGRPMLDWAVAHLRTEGISEVIINLHHLPHAIGEHVRRRDDYGVRVVFSRESSLMGTGGGVKRAEWFLKDGPFVLRNVDVLAGFPVRPLVEQLERDKALAVLAVQARETTRALLWGPDGRLCGRLSHGEPHMIRQPAGEMKAFGFSGIHAVSPRVFEMMPEDQPFCIVEFYLEMARRGETITAHRVDDFYWRDLGTRDSLDEAEQDLARADVAMLARLGIPVASSPLHREAGAE